MADHFDISVELPNSNGHRFWICGASSLDEATRLVAEPPLAKRELAKLRRGYMLIATYDDQGIVIGDDKPLVRVAAFGAVLAAARGKMPIRIAACSSGGCSVELKRLVKVTAPTVHRHPIGYMADDSECDEQECRNVGKSWLSAWNLEYYVVLIGLAMRLNIHMKLTAKALCNSARAYRPKEQFSVFDIGDEPLPDEAIVENVESWISGALSDKGLNDEINAIDGDNSLLPVTKQLVDFVSEYGDPGTDHYFTDVDFDKDTLETAAFRKTIGAQEVMYAAITGRGGP